MKSSLVGLVIINVCYGMLWKKGIVYYTINKLDYDVHSQDEITLTLAKLQEEICIKFFHQPPGNHSENKLLFISNPDKIKNCQPNNYDFTGNVVLMPIGYKCIKDKAIARVVVEMLRASIEQSVARVNSFDLVKKFHEKDFDPSHPALLAAVDRNYINAHYHGECGTLYQRVGQSGRREDDDEDSVLSEENVKYYKDKLWPLGIVMYAVEEKLRNTRIHDLLRHAMTTIELSTCIVFEEVVDDKVLTPRNMIIFGIDGEDTPIFGFIEGTQNLKLLSMVFGAPGHSAHILNNLMRILGVHMMSNRFDRDNYVTINWKNIVTGKERLLDKAPKAAWLKHMAYDFNSATHAPANYVCKGCELGATTVQPLQDHIWQRTMSMGHGTDLSDSDIYLLRLLYAKQCRNRFVSKDNIQESPNVNLKLE